MLPMTVLRRFACVLAPTKKKVLAEPRVNDGSLLFLQHMIDKFEPVRPAEHKHGSRRGIK